MPGVMKTLVIDLVDPSGERIGSAGSQWSGTVTVETDRDVSFTSGGRVPRQVGRVELLPDEADARVPVPVNDDPGLAQGSAGFALVVTATLRPRSAAAGRAWEPVTRKWTVTVASSAPAVVALSRLTPAEPLPPEWVSASDMTEAAQTAATIAQAAELQWSLPQMVTNPEQTIFGTTGWSYLGGTATSGPGPGDATVTGNGSTVGIGLQTSSGAAFVGKAGHRYLVQAPMTVPATSPQAQSLSVSLSDNASHVYVGGSAVMVSRPEPGRRYVVYGVVELPSDWDGKGIRLYRRAYFADTAASNGATVILHGPTVLDITQGYPQLPEPTARVLSSEIDALPGGFADQRLQRPAAAVVRRVFQPKTRRSVASGPQVILRFDDGFVNNLEVAAPILYRYGWPGTIYTCTGPALLSGVSAQHPLMNADQHRKLYEVYGWEIGSHTYEHDDAVDTDPAKWRASVERNINDIMGFGLPRPRSFAYPNGSRSAATDRLIYGLFDKCGLTGGGERLPWPHDRGTFFTSWSACGGTTDADGRASVAKAKQYIKAAFDRGCNPIIGLHGVTHEQPTVGHFLRADLLADLCQWIWAEGYPVSTQVDTPRHNMVADPGFMDQALTTAVAGGHPWYTATTNGWKQYSDPVAYGGRCARLAATSGIGPGSQTWVEQRVPVVGGESYRVYLHHCSPSLSAGGVDASLVWLDVLGATVGQTSIGASITAPSAEGVWVGGSPVTAPAAAAVARLQLVPSQASGVTGDVRVDSVAMFPTSTYDPLA